MGHDDRNPRDIYVQRINAAMDFIEANLRDELSLERVAGVANFRRSTFIGCSQQ